LEFNKLFELGLPETYKILRRGKKKLVSNDIRKEIEHINKLDMELYKEIIK